MQLKAFTNNSKTVLSIDFDRASTCNQICEYCYVQNLERIYPAYWDKMKRNSDWATTKPKTFAQQLNTEYTKLRNSKAKHYQRLHTLPVRMYGSGDYVPEHFKFLQALNFKFYIISKNLTPADMHSEIDKLLELNNLTNILLSFDNQNVLANYEATQNYRSHSNIAYAFTGISDDCRRWLEEGYNFDVFFTTGKTKAEQIKAQGIKAQCPCDSGLLTHNESCTHCNKCWRSNKTRGKAWNNLKQNELLTIS